MKSDIMTQLYMAGYYVLDPSTYSLPQSYFEYVAKLGSEKNRFQKDEKNAGSLTLNIQIPDQAGLVKPFIEMLFQSNLMTAVVEAVGRPLYLTNFMHIVTPPDAEELFWHRDTYLVDGKPTGLVPPSYKLIVYDVDVIKGGEFEVLGGTHRFDMNSGKFDRILSRLGYKSFVFRGKAGSAILFDAACIHRRRKLGQGQVARTATIFGLAQAKRHQEPYLGRHKPEISLFNEKLKRLSGETDWLSL